MEFASMSTPLSVNPTITTNPIVFQADNGLPNVSPCLIAAVARNAERVADMTAAALEASGLFSSPAEAKLPGSFLLELGAVVQLKVWERQGIRRHLELGLPRSSEASRELAARAAKGPAQFSGTEKAVLSQQVLRVWIENFAWDGQEIFQADVLVSEVDEEAFADALAEFLWTHRHELGLMGPWQLTKGCNYATHDGRAGAILYER